MFNDENACKSNMAFFCKKYMWTQCSEKQKTPVKLHRQFSHLTSSQLIALSNDCDIEDKGFILFITYLENNYEICMK